MKREILEQSLEGLDAMLAPVPGKAGRSLSSSVYRGGSNEIIGG
jgi:hypothetical protein